jgi:hypothetical protein
LDFAKNGSRGTNLLSAVCAGAIILSLASHWIIVTLLSFESYAGT